MEVEEASVVVGEGREEGGIGRNIFDIQTRPWLSDRVVRRRANSTLRSRSRASPCDAHTPLLEVNPPARARDTSQMTISAGPSETIQVPGGREERQRNKGFTSSRQALKQTRYSLAYGNQRLRFLTWYVQHPSVDATKRNTQGMTVEIHSSKEILYEVSRLRSRTNFTPEELSLVTSKILERSISCLLHLTFAYDSRLFEVSIDTNKLPHPQNRRSGKLAAKAEHN